MNPTIPTTPANPTAVVGGFDATSDDAIGDDAVRICSDLIRIDTTNTGDADSVGERAAAEYVMAVLAEAGVAADYWESAPRRASLVARIPGRDPARPALVLHGHLDVVPAAASDWRVDPFAGDVIDGELWGRGAVDMKDMDAMILAVVRDMARTGWQPARDLVIALFADEEAGGTLGAEWVVAHHPEVFEGASEAVGEVGGFSVDIGGQRAYLIQTAEKGLNWLRLVAHGTAGHGSAENPDNAVRHLAEAVARIAAHPWPVALIPATRSLFAGVAELTGLPFEPEDPASLDALVDAIGPARRFIAPSLRTALNPTRLEAGYKDNVVPASASATIDLRTLPGEEASALAIIDQLAGPPVSLEPILQTIAVQAPYPTSLTDAMADALRTSDPDAVVLPYLLPAGTDNKALSRRGLAGYGFVPLTLPATFDFTAMFHGVDERVPVESLRSGARVLAEFLRRC